MKVEPSDETARMLAEGIARLGIAAAAVDARRCGNGATA